MVGFYKIKKPKKWNFKRIKKFSEEYNINGNGIHITGTNGKGSVAKMIHSILSKNKKIGLFTSPHLISLNERIQIKEKIPNHILYYYLNKFYRLNKELSFFEILTLTAFEYFNKNKTYTNVVEVGMGGERDATNIINSNAGIITSISKDHIKQFKSIKGIANEKSGIIKGGKIVVANDFEIFRKKAKDTGAEIFIKNKDFFIKSIKITKKGTYFVYKDSDWEELFFTNLIGYNQAENAGLVVKLLKEMKIKKSKIKKGLKNVIWPGRFEIFGDYIFDCAHNEDGIKNLVKNIKVLYGNINVIFSCINKKPCNKMKNELKKVSKNFYQVKFPHPLSINGISFKNAIKKVNGPTLVTGSLYFIGHIYRHYKKSIMGKPGFEPG